MNNKQGFPENIFPGDFHDFYQTASSCFANDYEAVREYVVKNWERLNDGSTIRIRQTSDLAVDQILSSFKMDGVEISDWGIDVLCNLFDNNQFQTS